jgi:lipopolysaccharide transport system ATP-binding protein
MSKPVISVENLSKAYRIGAKEEVPDTLVGALKGIFSSPLKNLRRLRRMDTSGEQRETSGNALASDSLGETLWALNDVSFDVNEGDVVGIIGRNGAGKSTLLKILSRITEPTSGRAVIRGRVSSLLEVGTGFHPELTGRENIYMNGTILGMTKKEIDRKFDEIVEFSGVQKFLDTPTKRYSSGMQVRLAFAVAAHLEPEILIVDEVLAVGDSQFQTKCIGKMQDVANSGRTVIFVSHSMNAVRRLCSLGLVLDRGSASGLQSCEEAIAKYDAKVPCLSKSWSIHEQNAPGDEIIKLLSISVLQQSQATELLMIDYPITLSIEYEVLEDGHCPIPNVHFFTSDGQVVFVSHDSDADWHTRPKAKGIYNSKCVVPGNYLNTVDYDIGVAITSYHPFIVHCFERESLKIHLDEGDAASVYRAGYAGTVPGTVRPCLSWNTMPLRTQVEL